MRLAELKTKAQHLDAEDPLKALRKQFELPKTGIYLCSNSLGLPAKSAFTLMQKHMQKWSELGAHAWFSEEEDWYTSLEKPIREPLANLLGAKYDEVVVMNSLTINLHLLLISFYQPIKSRYKIVMDTPTFPSDLYAIKSHLKNHGLDPKEALILLKPREGEALLRQEDIANTIKAEGKNIAVVFLSSVNYLTGQVFDMENMTKLAHEQGCLVGFDLAHAAGNIPLHLHEQQVDFAVGCSYKYLCSGPGGPGIAYVHTSHHKKDFPRLSGWWGNDPSTRFQMDVQTEFVPHGGAYSWNTSTPSILAMLPLLASLQIFQTAGIENLRKKSERQTAFLLELLTTINNGFSITTPLSPQERGNQLSLQIHKNAKHCQQSLIQQQIICDYRPPNILRITPSPLYTSFTELYEFTNRFIKVLS